MKPKKLTLQNIFLFLLPLTLATVTTGCDEDAGGFVEKEIFKFSNFGCETNWKLKQGYNNNYYIINSQAELSKYFESDCTPQIDFNEYFVIIGSKSFTTGSSLFSEKLEENNKEIVYTVTFLPDDTLIVSGVKYHAVIEKPVRNKVVKVDEIIKNQP